MRVTLNGFYEYDKTLFDDIVLPVGIDKGTLINEIMKRGDLFPYHQALPYLRLNIGYWFSRKYFDFEMIFKALRTKYNPLENYDRYEELNRQHFNKGSDKTESDINTNSSNVTTLGSTTTNTERVSAYDSADFTNSSQTSNTGSGSDRAENESHSGNTSTTTYGSSTHDVDDNHIHGNIGVTQTSDMARNELFLRREFDLYTFIADEFEKEFLIQVY